jgi:acyl-CoA-binding protein
LKGDNDTKKPGPKAGKEARDKWDNWNAEKGKPEDKAADEYLDLAKSLLGENQNILPALRIRK